ncbi:uncharacterized protein LOC142332165 [Lycorma delicatula]|uniref:uncharacterized protein LOC142332165 n=1 Tax=Lycorma delicatula TaxID=130591 RepID=UPI003F5186FA
MDKENNVHRIPIIVSAKKLYNNNNSNEGNLNEINEQNYMKEKTNSNNGKEIIYIETPHAGSGSISTTTEERGGQHVVKIRVNPASSSLTSSSVSPLKEQELEKPVQSFPSPLEIRTTSNTKVSGLTERIDTVQSSLNRVRINIKSNSDSTTATRTSSILNDMVPTPLPPNSSYLYYNNHHLYNNTNNHGQSKKLEENPHLNGEESTPNDSGICSDIDSTGTPSPLLKNKNETTTINTMPSSASTSSTSSSQSSLMTIDHRRISSLTSSVADMEDSDEDSLDSMTMMNSNDFEIINNNNNNKTKIIKLTKKQSNRRSEDIKINRKTENDIVITENNKIKSYEKQRKEVEEEQNVEEDRDKHNNTPVIEERTYEERRNDCVSSIIISDNNKNNNSENFDSFYKFHLNENNFDNNFNVNNNNKNKVIKNGSVVNEDELMMVDYFAGCKNYKDGEISETSTIKSSKGTIRGVKNRVRAGIATFLQMHATKTWQEKEAGRVVVYTTTMGIVRETYQRCLKVRQILRTHLVKFEEKDVFMSREIQTEIKERMSCDNVVLPQVFVEGQHIGDAETIDRLNESGELRRILKPYKSPDACTTCKVCGGYRLLPCPVCNGSKKSVHRNHFTTELVALKCMNCDEVGLIKCYAC